MKIKNKKNILMNISILMLLLAGLGIMIYPAFSDFLARRNYTAAILSYGDEVNNLSQGYMNSEIEAAHLYNKTILQTNAIPFSNEEIITDHQYMNLLNVGGMMGRIHIPKINVNLPIYHGSSEEVLQKGVGHLFGTSLPVGGKGTHSSLTAHTGLPSAKLFTDLTEIEIGDRFYIDILNETLAYQIDQIRIVEPNDIEELQINEDRDLVTLITCTPYGINSHRLLVRGSRIAMEVEEEAEHKQVVSNNIIRMLEENWWILVLVAVIVIVLIIFSIRFNKHRNQRRPQK